MAVNRVELLGFDLAHFVHRLADNIEHAAQHLFAYWNTHRAVEADRLHAADKSLGRLQSDHTHPSFTDVLRDFTDDVDRRRYIETLAGDANRRANDGDLSFVKL